MPGPGFDARQVQAKAHFRLTGLHVLLIAIGFFGSVITIDVTMAILAVKTFSGVEAERPYEHGLAFNREIKAAQEQDARNWSVTQKIERGVDGLSRFSVYFQDNAGMAIAGLDVKMNLKAPADAKRDLSLDLEDHGAGMYHGAIHAQSGQWTLELVAKDQNAIVYKSLERISLQ